MNLEERLLFLMMAVLAMDEEHPFSAGKGRKRGRNFLKKEYDTKTSFGVWKPYYYYYYFIFYFIFWPESILSAFPRWNQLPRLHLTPGIYLYTIFLDFNHITVKIIVMFVTTTLRLKIFIHKFRHFHRIFFLTTSLSWA